MLITVYFSLHVTLCRSEREIILCLYVTRPLVVSGQSRNSGGPKRAEVGEGARDRELKKKLINNCRHCWRRRRWSRIVLYGGIVQLSSLSVCKMKNADDDRENRLLTRRRASAG